MSDESQTAWQQVGAVARRVLRKIAEKREGSE